MSERPIPRNETENRLAEFTQLAREVVEVGMKALGPALCAAVLDFAAKAVEQRARIDGRWKPEESSEYRAAAQASLDELAQRWRARKAAAQDRKPS